MSEPFVFNNTDVILGVDPPSPKPLFDEYKILEPVNPSALTVQAGSFLQTKFGVLKSSDLAADAVYIVLGNPRYEKARGLVVSDVLNKDIKGWGPVTGGKDTIARPFGPTDVGVGLYVGSQVYVHKLSEGQNFFDYLGAATMSPMGILFNAHFKNYSNAVYHEVFHTFQGSKLTAQDLFKEGIVEYVSVLFASGVYGLKFDFFPAYAPYIPDAEKLIAYVGLANVARAFFADDDDAIALLAPLFYEPIAKTLPTPQQLSTAGVLAGKSLPSFSGSGLMGSFVMRKEGSWYRQWIAKNGGTVPIGGLTLPEKKPSAFGNLPPPTMPPIPSLQPPPIISPIHTPELSRGSGVTPLVTNATDTQKTI